MRATINPSSYPTFQLVMDLVRVHLNDWQMGLTLTPGEGQITTNSSPQTLPALNSAIRTLYRKLRNAGAPTLIKDDVRVVMPSISSFLNPPDAQAQVELSYQGFWDGWQVFSTASLPPDFLYPINCTEQIPANTNAAFQDMIRAAHGLPSVAQGFYNKFWEWRGDALWFPGTLGPIEVCLRYKARLPQFFGKELNFITTMIPIMDCEEFVAWETAYIIAAALEGITPTSQSVQNLKAEADNAMFDLKQAYVLQAQNTNYRRPPYEAEGSY